MSETSSESKALETNAGSTKATDIKTEGAGAAAAPSFEELKLDKMKGSKKSNKGVPSFLIWILFIFVLISLGASAYLWQQLQFVSGDLLKNSSYQLDLQKNQKSFSDIEKAINASEAKISQSDLSIAQLLESQNQIKISLSNISGVNRVDWLVEELQHLARLAHQRLVLSHDAEGAIALLKAADQVVVDMREGSALPIRKAIADDILNLKLAANIDLEGTFIRLNSLNAKIEELNLKQPSFPDYTQLETGEQQDSLDRENNTDENFLQKTVNAINKIVAKIRPYLYRNFEIEGDIKPLLNIGQRDYLMRNLQLSIEQAQLALLRREAQSYRLSLEQAEQWIKQYYDKSDPSTSTILSIISELKEKNLSPSMPSLENTLGAIRYFSENWQQEKVTQTKAKIKVEKAVTKQAKQEQNLKSDSKQELKQSIKQSTEASTGAN